MLLGSRSNCALVLGVTMALCAASPEAGTAPQARLSTSRTPLPRKIPPAGAAGPQVALVDDYCLSCHDKDHEKGGLVLETISAEDIPQHPEVWEKVVRKLRARLMPPVGKERPDEPTYDAVVSYLEKSLDRAA